MTFALFARRVQEILDLDRDELIVRRCLPFRYSRVLHRIHEPVHTRLDTILGKEGRRMTRPAFRARA
ncbi:MAG: hypothetical protein OXC54_11730 [Rhodospirillaceae bacterium]|nr:hypothetical protein [Rhodospirillaceae bacterium]MCY4238903.1 hypothetical protein [Rhodospirillaceae bacterium]MCY4311957.1 hypothetical protein [Rhodospirillaceae bacterium]